MKKLLVVSAVAALNLSAVAFAGGLPEEMPIAPAAVVSSDMGPYIGIEGGYGMTNWKIFNSDHFSKDNGVVGRAFLGYDINKYFAAEFGYTYFFNKARHEVNANNYTDIKTQVFDLMGKIKAPIVDEVSLYAKLGADYMLSNMSKTGTDNTFKDNSYKTLSVAYGAGLDYAITPNVIANLEWLRHNGKIKADDDSRHLQPYTDSFMVGLRYRFDV